MKTIETQLFTFSELSEAAKTRALDNLRNQAQTWEPHCMDEMLDSLKAICKAGNVQLRDWAYGPYCQGSKVKISHSMEDESGPRALAWFLKVLIEHGYTRPKTFAEMQFPGVCGFTGVCYDEDTAETIWKALSDGDTVAEAFDAVAATFCKSAEAEAEYQTSDEYLLESMDQDEEIYTEDGNKF